MTTRPSGAGRAPLTPTAYIILGLLTSRDWSAYELAEQVGRGVTIVWSRADRQRYNTTKRLAELGLTTARTEAVGRRSRTVYSITPAGRKALRDWLTTDPAPATMEFEGMIRVLVAEQGTIEDLRSTLTTVRAQAEQTLALFGSHARLFLETGGTFPERGHLFALANRFVVGHAEHVIEWTTWALDHIATWPDTTSPVTDDADRTRAIYEGSVAAAETQHRRP